jgi:hypothetical protein
MGKDWKKIARANRLAIPDADLERMTPVLNAMEAAFRPLAQALPWELEPAIVFHAAPEDAA